MNRPITLTGLFILLAGTSGLAPADKGRASGILNTAQQVGIAVGVAALVSAAAVESARPEVLASGYGTGLRLGAFVAVAGAVFAAAGGRTRFGIVAGDGESAFADRQ